MLERLLCPGHVQIAFNNVKCRKYYHSIAKYCNSKCTNGLAISGDSVPPKMGYL